jgi:membrane protein
MWQIRYESLFRRFNYKELLHTLVVLIKDIYTSLDENRCLIRAAALTYVTIFSIVPFLAVAFSISKGLGFHHTEFIYNFLLKITANKEDVVNNILTYINNTNVAKLGTLGVATLLMVVLSLLGTIEDTLNIIFEIPKNRSLKQKFTHYFSITLISPILLIVFVTFTSSLSSIGFIKKILSYSIISHVYLFILKFVPFFIVWFSIFMIFYYLPNGKVDFKSVGVGSFCAAILWQVSRYVFINYHPFNVKYNAIYGSFAKVLLVLLWIFLSWFMLLIGAVIAHEIKVLKYGRYKYKYKLGYFNIAFKEYIFLKIILYMIAMFKKGDGVVKLDDLSDFLKLPSFIVKDFIFALMESGFVVKVNDNEKHGFLIASDVEQCSLYYFLEVIRNFSDVPYRSLKQHERTYFMKLLSHDYSIDKNILLGSLSLNMEKGGILQN